MALAEYNRYVGANVDDFIVAIGAAANGHELGYCAVDIADRYGFDYVCLIRLPVAEDGLDDNGFVYSNIPRGLGERAAERIGSLIEHAVRETREAVDFLHLDIEDDGAEARQPAGHPGDVGDAYFFSVHSASGARGLAGYFGRRRRGDLLQMLELNYLSGLLFDRFEALSRVRGNAGRLSRREIECLKWTAIGKTSAEIATILNLSEHTVNNYLSSVCQKLDTVNRTHAVANALRQGIIA